MAEIKKINTELQPIDKLLDTSGDAGTSGQILSTTGSGTNWIDNVSGTVTGSGAATRVAFWSSSSALSSNADLYWDNTNSRLGIETITPAQKLHIISTDGANIILNSNTGAENSGIWMTEAAAASPYTNGAYVYYDGTNNAFKINTGTTTLSTRFTIDRDTGVTTFAKNVIISTTDATAPGNLLTLYNTQNGGGASILFSDQNTSAQKGTLTFYHSDGASQGGGASFHFTSTEPNIAVIAGDSSNNGRFLSKSLTSNTLADFSFVDDPNTGMLRPGADALRFVTGGTAALDLNSSQNATFAGYVAATNFRPTNIVTNKVVKFDGTSLDDSSITDTGSAVTIANPTTITGKFTVNNNVSGTTIAEFNNSHADGHGVKITIGNADTNRAAFQIVNSTAAQLYFSNYGQLMLGYDYLTTPLESYKLAVAGTSYFLGDATFAGDITITQGFIDITQTSITEPVLRLTDSGVADYEFTFPDTSTIQLGTNTSSTKSLKLLNAGTGDFGLIIGDNGIISWEDHGGGWFMEDSTFLKTYGNKSLYGTGNVHMTSFMSVANSAYYLTPAAAGTALNVAGDIVVPAVKKLYLDGGSDTWIYEDVANEIKFVAGGSSRGYINSSGIFSEGNIYTGTSGAFRNYGGVWTASTGISGNGFQFFNTADNSSAILFQISSNSTSAATSIGLFAGKVQSQTTITGDGSQTLTTKNYVDGLIVGATIYQGTWDARTSGEGGSGAGGSPDLTTSTYKTNGYYFVVSYEGTATPNGPSTTPALWHVGDWVIYNDHTGSGAWQKIDNSSVLSGTGTGQKVIKWDGSGTSDTIADGPITFSSNDSTFAGTVTGTTARFDTLNNNANSANII